MSSNITNYMWCIHVAVRVNSERRIRDRLALFTTGWVNNITTSDFLVLSFFESEMLGDLVHSPPIQEHQDGYENILAFVPSVGREQLCRQLYELLFRYEIVEWPRGVCVPPLSCPDSRYEAPMFEGDPPGNEVATANGMMPELDGNATDVTVACAEKAATPLSPDYRPHTEV